MVLYSNRWNFDWNIGYFINAYIELQTHLNCVAGYGEVILVYIPSIIGQLTVWNIFKEMQTKYTSKTPIINTKWKNISNYVYYI